MAKPTRAELLDKAVRLAEQSMRDTSYPGICISCGHEEDGCEPDACNYECEVCESATVFGAEELILRLSM